ncbi:LytR family transcriptional regulator [Microbacterium protaetiae]|uniref:LytR family transcriptional regulator n=1 Tax=Microbacterium protaetiae TaxID=2509458 RepID=A0A4P6E9Q1_9MICO|nr:LytR C-terminal domain-containing protein [Microbacterium protaetiae]QAY58745.1 LytR family transcriptional regulator [Microbacterium protaetiae]
MPKPSYPRDRFDDAPVEVDRVGAHRAENPHLRAGVIVIWAAVTTVVLIAVGVVGTLALTGRFGTPAAGPTTAAPTTSVTPVIDTSFTVLILNATGESGQATVAQDAVVRAGWDVADVLPSEAGSTYPTTTVYYADAADQAAAAGLAKIVGASSVVLDDQYQSTTDAKGKQLTVVLGTDLVAPSGSPTP